MKKWLNKINNKKIINKYLKKNNYSSPKSSGQTFMQK